MKDHIAHISDWHVRFGSRHDEYDSVFARVEKDLLVLKPRRIVLTGDLFHTKINLSPLAIEVAGVFIKRLSLIAPVDIIPGNHDANLKVLEQGNAINPIVRLIHNGHIITKDNQDKPLPSTEGANGVYFFKESGFYQIDDELVYGVYSCFDDEILTLSEKEPGKKYIALYHAPIYGCRGDNGYEMKSDHLVRVSTFNNFDMVLMGDIHEYQAFERTLDGGTVTAATPFEDRIESMAYAGSLIQQSFGESIDKGYLLWNIRKHTHERRYIPNDYGYCKLVIAKGEIIEDRLEDLKFSLDKRRTKIQIVLEDDEENYSAERISQLEKSIKDKHRCYSVQVIFRATNKVRISTVEDSEEDADVNNTEAFETMLLEYLKTNEYENIEDVMELSREVDRNLNLVSILTKGRRWDINSVETYNLFSQPAKATKFDLDVLSGITGIFGDNYSGKSNLIRAIVWVGYQEMLGGGDPHTVINMYTGESKGWGRMIFTLDGVRYMIYRSASLKWGKSKTNPNEKEPKMSYNVEYKYEKVLHNEDGSERRIWVDAESEEAALEKKEIKKVIIDTIGTYHDFTKVALQTQDRKDDYLSLTQQPKNDLVSKFLGLEVFRDRFEFANKTFNKTKAIQKHLGNPTEIEAEIESTQGLIEKEKVELTELGAEKQHNVGKIEDIRKEIVEMAKGLVKIENLTEKNPDVVRSQITQMKPLREQAGKDLAEAESWLEQNFKRDMPVDRPEDYDKATLEGKLTAKRATFANETREYGDISKWLSENGKKPEITDIKPVEDEIDFIKNGLKGLEDQRKLAKGEKCPTCEHVKHEANPELERQLTERISKGQKMLADKRKILTDNADAIKHNMNVDRMHAALEMKKADLQVRKTEIDAIKEKLGLSDKVAEIIKINAAVEAKSQAARQLRTKIESYDRSLRTFEEQLVLIEKNARFIEDNAVIDGKIKELEDDTKAYQIANLQLDGKIKEASGNIRVWENNIVNLRDKLSQIREADRIYKKYSIYLQAVDRDGIPATIIKKKLPIINQKLNSVLQDMVKFKVEMYIKPNGDVKESFYFSGDKSDKLSLASSSGAQKFLTSIAITDALHYVSCLPKPSIRFIDEGFGALDNNKSEDVYMVLDYLKSRYKNVLIITHKNEIKDFVDHIIQVGKTKIGVAPECMNENPEMGISTFNIL